MTFAKYYFLQKYYEENSVRWQIFM